MNRYYSYPNIELWKTETWSDRVAPVSKLIEHIQEITPILESDYIPSFDADAIEDVKRSPYYNWKLRGYEDPAVFQSAEEKGLIYHATSQGGKDSAGHPWYIFCPKWAVEQKKKLPVLCVFDVEDEKNPLWMMRAVKRYEKYIDLAALRQDFIFAVLVNEKPGYDKVYFNIMQEFSVLFPCDVDRFYLDVTVAAAYGKLSQVEGFRYTDRSGAALDPDGAIEDFLGTGIPVLDISGRWGNCDSLERGLVVTYDMNEGRFDRERFIHSGVGKRMARDMLYEYRYDTVEDPRFQKEMEDKGFVYEVARDEYGDRYIVAFPREAYETRKPVPLVMVLQEVYGGNEHLAVTAHSYLGEWLEIAAQGECGLLYYVMENNDTNERIIEIARRCAERYPFDLTRVYATGHSHDGYFAFELANRHPDFITAIALLGSAPAPKAMNARWDYSLRHELMDRDMPTVVINAMWEGNPPADRQDMLERFMPQWEYFFKVHRIPPRSAERYLAVFESAEYAERMTCLPGDRFSTLWSDGIEHYIVDFRNVEGKEHLRVIRQENMPHTVTPMMCTLSWDFLRRFRLDPETGRIRELF